MGGSLGLGRAGRVLLHMTLFGMFGAGARAAIHRPRAVLESAPNRYAVAVSPDGNRIAIKAAEGEAGIFDASDGKLVPPAYPVTGLVALAFSPDGKSLAIGHFSGVSLVASSGGAQAANFPVHHIVGHLTFSPDSTTLYVSDSAPLETARFSIATQNLVGRWQPVGPNIAFSPDHKTLVAWGQSPTVYLCAPDLTIRARLEGQQKPPGAYTFVSAVAFSPDSKTLATASPDGSIYLWNVNTGTLRAKLFGHALGVNAIAFSPDGRTLVSASQDTMLRIWNVPAGRPIGMILGHEGPVLAVAYSPDGSMVASGSGDGTARLWDPDTLRERSCMLGVDGPVGHVLFIRGGKGLFAAGGTTGKACLFDVPFEDRPGPATHVGSAIPLTTTRPTTTRPAGFWATTQPTSYWPTTRPTSYWPTTRPARFLPTTRPFVATQPSSARPFSITRPFLNGRITGPAGESYALLEEARRNLNATAPLQQKIDDVQTFITLLAAAKEGNIEPLRGWVDLHARGTEQTFARPGVVGLLCGMDAPAAAENIAATDPLYYYSLWRVARWHLDHGHRGEAIRVFKLAATRQNALGAAELGASAPYESPVLSPFLKAGDVSAAAAIAKSVNPLPRRVAAMIYVARGATALKKNAEAADLLHQADVILAMKQVYSGNNVDEGTRAFYRAQLSLAANAIDPALASASGDDALAILRQLPIAHFYQEHDPVREVARALWMGGDHVHGRAAFDLLGDRATAEASPTGQTSVWEAGMAQAGAGDYVGAARTTRRFNPTAGLGRCMDEGRMPQTSDEAKAFLKAFGNLPYGNKGRKVRVLVLAGRIEEARSLAHAEPPTPADLAGQLAEINRMDLARQEVSRVQDERLRVDVEAAVASGLLERGDVAGAMAIITTNPSTDAFKQLAGRAATACLAQKRFADAARAASLADELGQTETARKLSALGRLDEILVIFKEGKRRRMTDFGFGYFVAGPWCRRGAPDKALAALAGESGFEAVYKTRPGGANAFVAGEWVHVADAQRVAVWARALPNPADRAACLVNIVIETLLKADTVAEEYRARGQQYYPLEVLHH